MKLSIIIPAYNEEKRISDVLRSYFCYFSVRCDCEIIVVSDGSDNTGKIVSKMSSSEPNVILVEAGKRLGKGGGIIHGVDIASGDIIGYVDSDKSVSPEEFEKVISHLECYGCAIASRRMAGARISGEYSIFRRFSSLVFNILVNALFDLDIKDTQCGAKVFKREVIKDVLPLLRTRGFEFDVELLWRIKKRGYSIREVPVDWTHMDGSTFSLWNSFSMFTSLVKIRLIGFMENKNE